jgi:hypothetical protein
MCDYSLEHIASRPAVVGDELTVTRFVSCTTGFEGADKNVAVCLLPGTEIAFSAPIQKITTQYYGLSSEPHTYEHAVGVFTQIIKPEMTCGYHKDALELPDGQKVLLNDLAVGQKATVLQLPKAGIDELPGQSVMDHIELAPAPKVEAPTTHYADELVRY